MRRFGKNLILKFCRKITKFENLKKDVTANLIPGKNCYFLIKFEFYVEFEPYIFVFIGFTARESRKLDLMKQPTSEKSLPNLFGH